MSRQLYKNLIQLLKEWPVDDLNKTRDFKESVKNQILKYFLQGEASVLTPSYHRKCEQIYGSLRRIERNTHAKKYPRVLESTALGISPEDCMKLTEMNSSNNK